MLGSAAVLKNTNTGGDTAEVQKEMLKRHIIFPNAQKRCISASLSQLYKCDDSLTNAADLNVVRCNGEGAAVIWLL